MKNKLMHNLGLKLLSLLAAVLIWLVIIYTYDPADTADFTLDVTILNEDAITSLDKVYEIIEGDEITIRVKGNTSLVNNLKASDFKATADISKLSPTYHASIHVECTKTNNVEISFLGDVNLLAIRLEDVAEKQFKVTVVPEGEPEEGYYVGASTTKPNLIQVRGAETAINRISEVRVPVDVTDADRSFKSEAAPKAYDAEGNEITTGSLTFSRESIAVTTAIYGTREVPIEIVTTGEAYDGYRLVGVEYEPKTIRVAGTEEDLDTISSIQIPISVANRITDLEENYLLEDYVPEEVHLTDTEASVNVFLDIERLATRNYEVNYNSIHLRNASYEAWQYRLMQTGSFTVKVRGLQEDLDSLEVLSLRPYIDVTELDEVGEYIMNVSFELDEEFEVQGVSSVTVMVAPLPEIPTEDPEGADTGNDPDGENPDGEDLDGGSTEDGAGEGTGSSSGEDPADSSTGSSQTGESTGALADNSDNE